MSIHVEPQHLELEAEGRCNLVLIAVRYTGDRSSVPAHRWRRDAAWPGHSAFQALGDDDNRQPGPPQFALIPDWTDEDTENRTVEAFEASDDMAVYYTPEAIAEAMLEVNSLPENAFDRGYDDRVREKVFDHLGISYEGTDELRFRETLREIAGVDADDDTVQAEARDDSLVSQYRREHTRGELVEAAAILGFEDDHEYDASGRGRIELATWLADQDREAVRFAFEGKPQAARDANAGVDVDASDVEPFDVGKAVETYEPEELKTVVKAVREGTGEFSLRGAGAESMAEFLVEAKGLSEDEIDAHLTE